MGFFYFNKIGPVPLALALSPHNKNNIHTDRRLKPILLGFGGPKTDISVKISISIVLLSPYFLYTVIILIRPPLETRIYEYFTVHFTVKYKSLTLFLPKLINLVGTRTNVKIVERSMMHIIQYCSDQHTSIYKRHFTQQIYQS